VHDLVLIQQLLHLSLLGLTATGNELEMKPSTAQVPQDCLADVLQNQGLVAGHPETTLENVPS
jgi:hypothetical protein